MLENLLMCLLENDVWEEFVVKIEYVIDVYVMFFDCLSEVSIEIVGFSCKEVVCINGL